MTTTLNRDARQFVSEIAKYVGDDKRGKKVAPRVTTLLSKVTNAAKKERIAEVTSVVVLDAHEKATIQKLLIKILGHDVECHFVQDPGLLGGIKIQVADWVVDTSLSTQLAHMKQTLL